MIIKKCSRCGVLYEAYDDRCDDRYYVSYENKPYEGLIKDLCPECTESFFEWSKQKHKNRENEDKNDFPTSNQYVRYKILVTENARNVENNTSSVTVEVLFYRTNEGFTTYGRGAVLCKIGGTLYVSEVSPEQDITDGGVVLFSQTVDIKYIEGIDTVLICSAWISLDTPLISDEQTCVTVL